MSTTWEDIKRSERSMWRASLLRDELEPIYKDILMPSCKYCNASTVKWLRVGSRWVLYNVGDNTPHYCQNQNAQGPSQNEQINPEPSGTGQQQVDPADDSFVSEPSLSEQLEQEVNASASGEQEGQGKGEKGENPSDKGDEGEEGEGGEVPKPVKNPTDSFKTCPKPVKQSFKDGHKQMKELYLLLALGQKVFVSGPAGSGKTTAFKLVAPALGHHFGRDDYEFFFKSVCDLTGKHEFEGFINAAGQIVDSDFRKAYIEGHLFLIDEIDASNANVLTVLNATIENGWASFPDGKAPQHPHFRIGVAANTVGLGSDGIYIGRNPLDGAFRNRFYFLIWDYDEVLELSLAGKDQIKWVERVWSIRRAHQSLGKLAPRIVVSPRASIHGAHLLRSKFTKNFKLLEDALIWQGCADDDKTRVLKAIKV